MWVDSIRYFNGNQLIEYTRGREGVEYVSFKENVSAEVGFSDGTVLKIQSPFIEYKSRFYEEDNEDAKEFGW